MSRANLGGKASRLFIRQRPTHGSSIVRICGSLETGLGWDSFLGDYIRENVILGLKAKAELMIKINKAYSYVGI